MNTSRPMHYGDPDEGLRSRDSEGVLGHDVYRDEQADKPALGKGAKLGESRQEEQEKKIRRKN